MSRNQRFRESYDWVVLGDSPPVLLSACLAARMGLSVLIVGEGNDKKWELAPNGQLIDPEPNFILGLGQHPESVGSVATYLEHLKVSDSEWDNIHSHAPLLQALTPRARIGFSRSTEDIRRECRRELGSRATSILDFLDALELVAPTVRRFDDALSNRLTRFDPPRGGGHSKSSTVIASQTQKLIIKELGTAGVSSPYWLKHPDSRECLHAWMAGALGYEPSENLSEAEVLQSLCLSQDSASFRGGISGFRNLLYRVAKRLGAQIADPATEVARIFFEEGRIAGVQFVNHEDNRNLIRARGLISNQHPDLLMAWMPDSLRGGSISQDFANGLRVTLALTVARDELPASLGKRAIWYEDGASSLELERTFAADYGLADSHTEILFLRSIFPDSSREWSVEHWRSLCARMFGQAAQVIPFLDEKVLQCFPDFRGSEFESHWNWFYGDTQMLSRAGVRVVQRVNSKRRVDAIEGFFHVHPATTGGCGAVGEWEAALNGIAWLAHRSGLSGSLGS